MAPSETTWGEVEEKSFKKVTEFLNSHTFVMKKKVLVAQTSQGLSLHS
jgi:hypothetical protein